ncbi:MAG: STAS domain-containing protein [Candidatus Methanoperedenaceae archaeon]|nr:STAS domain-containing protein [Candidatus Methanoperedenaceae archaeon]
MIGNEKLLEELTGLLEDNADQLKNQWVKEMTEMKLLEKLTPVEIEQQSSAIYDTCVLTIKNGNYDAAKKYAREMAKKGVLEAMTVDQIIMGMLKLRDVYGRFIFSKYQQEVTKLYKVLDIYEPIANRILNIVALAFVQERERVINEQQLAMLELSTPVLQIRDQILVVPLIGTIDSARAAQIVEQLLNSIVDTQASIVIIDITGVPVIDTAVANHLIKTIQASKMLGADTIITGISPANAQTLVSLGVDLSMMTTKGTLRSGMKLADEMLRIEIVEKV